MKNSSLFMVLMASTVITVAAPVPARAETLGESIDMAIASHPSVDTALAGKVIAKEEYAETRSGLFPELSANLSGGRIYSDNSTSRGLTVDRGAAYSWLGEGSATLTQPLFDGFGTWHRMDAAKARSLSADYTVIDQKENLSLQATQSHIAVMQAQDTLDKTQSYYNVIEDYLERIQLMVDEGVADESEAAQARNISLSLKSTLTDYEGQLEAAYAGYREIVGQMPKSDLVKPRIVDHLFGQDLEGMLSEAKSTHPLIVSGLKELEASGYDVKSERSAFYPEIDGELSYLQKDQKEEIGGELEDARALLKMTWDFETGGAQQARVRKTQAQYSEILAQNRETVRAIEGELRRAYAEYETARNQLDLVKQREKVTKELFDAYEVQFEGARVRLLQLMQAENQLFGAQLESITAEYRYLLAQYRVLASMGKLYDTMQGDFAFAENFAQNEEVQVSEVVEQENVDYVTHEDVLETSDDLVEEIHSNQIK
ncbi:MAG: TolC family protein [Alphaproteobacteria bacterium]|nr:TolC family protein [Alphaproteobacteria bacterium]